MKLLILGGTHDAVRLAYAVADLPGLDIITSLAGRTDNAPTLPGALRVGGFGGVDGLVDYLKTAAIDRVIDATHPFAAQISAHAQQACDHLNVPRLMLRRPSWPQQPGDHWVAVADMAAAAQALPQYGRRAFLTIGIGAVPMFAQVAGVHFLVRLIADQPLPLADYHVVTGKGPFDAAAEQQLMHDHGVDVVVTKASGGAATYGKIAAARALALPVIMVQRPTPPAGAQAASVAECVAWITSPA